MNNVLSGEKKSVLVRYRSAGETKMTAPSKKERTSLQYMLLQQRERNECLCLARRREKEREAFRWQREDEDESLLITDRRQTWPLR